MHKKSRAGNVRMTDRFKDYRAKGKNEKCVTNMEKNMSASKRKVS